VRPGLAVANETAPNTLDGYPKGSTVICAHCFVPLFRLERGIYPGENSARGADAHRPISLIELAELRRDVPSVNAALKAWTFEDMQKHCASIGRPKTGDPAVCPACERSYVQVFAPEAGEAIDRAYTWRLVTIPPLSGPYPVRSSHVRL